MALAGQALRAAIEAAPFIGNHTTQYRATALAYFRTLESTVGAWGADNRFTPARLSHAIYTADGMDIALREATQGFQAEFHQPEMPAHAVYPVHIRATRILDLTDPGIHALLGERLMTLTGDWRGAALLKSRFPQERVETHEIGAAAFEVGLQGIRYPSAFDVARANTVFFTEHLPTPPEAILPDIVQQARALLPTEP